MATTWETIFPFPRADAGITTPRPAATFRRPVTANSLPMMITTIHAGTAFISTREMNAAAVRSLSANGSRSIPNFVTWLRRRAK